MLSTIAMMIWTMAVYLAGHTRIATRFLPKNPLQKIREAKIRELDRQLEAGLMSAMGTPVVATPTTVTVSK